MRWSLILSAVAAALVVLAPPSLVRARGQEPARRPSLYDEQRAAAFEPAGRIRNRDIRLDRFTLQLTDGELYLSAPVAGQVTGVIFLGRGRITGYPPDGVEHHQLKKLTDEDFVDEAFDRFVSWTSGDLAEQLRALADGSPGRDARLAASVFDDRREALFEEQFINPDSRILADRWRPEDSPAAPVRLPYVLMELHGTRRGWFAIEVDADELEEVRLWSFNTARKASETWMGFHALAEFDGARAARAFAGFPRDPRAAGRLSKGSGEDWDFRDLGLDARPPVPDREQWSPRVTLPRIDVDLALAGDGDATASVAMLVESQTALSSLRLQVSPFAKVTDVRWRQAPPADAEDVRNVRLLTPAESGVHPAADEPVGIAGDALPFVQEVHKRRLDDDLYEPWLTVLLPRTVAEGERFVLEIAYEGELVERLISSQEFLLKDTLYWIPHHPDNRRSRFHLTFRVPRQHRIASGGELVADRVNGDTRIVEWVTDRLVRSDMAFQYGQFAVEKVESDGVPPVAVYANRNHRGFAPGAREDTLKDLLGALRTYAGYFGPYPFASLLVTETPAYNGQAFPGLVLLTFQTFGELHTAESALFRAHEVAHQWWGAAVAWEHYRDQWLSEGFAHYSAALYALSGQNGPDEFQDVLDAWRLDVLGEVNMGQGFGKHYGFMPASMRRSKGHRSGPVAAGYRLSTVETPFDYRLLVYEKGAFILHMLRMMLTNLETGDDSRFRELMAGFARDSLARPASTPLFEAAVTRAFDQRMGWFFDQWVYGVEVPTYTPKLAVVPVSDRGLPFALRGTIKQDGVFPGFRMPVPIRVRFKDQPPKVYYVWVDAESVDVDLRLPAQPVGVDFNLQHAVLARVK